MRSGQVNLSASTGALRDDGIDGYWWTSHGSSKRFDNVSAPSAYNLNFDATRLYPSAGPDNRWFALPLRCLSTVLDMIEQKELALLRAQRVYRFARR